MKIHQWGAAVAAMVMLSHAANAQPIWTFEQILQSALSSHPALMGKRFAQAAANANEDGAKWQRYPSPSMDFATLAKNGGSGVVRIDQPLWTAGRLSADINAAHSRVEAALAAVEEEKLNLSLRVIAAYTEAAKQKNKQQHARDGVAAHEKLLDMIRRRLAQEVSSLTDLRLAESRMYQATNELSVTAQALRNSLAQLTQLAGHAVMDIDMVALPSSDALTSLEAALAQALRYSPTLRRLAFDEEAASADIVSKRAAVLPRVALRLERDLGESRDHRAMLVVMAQPGAGLSGASAVDAAIQNREAARMASESAMRDAEERITLDWHEWKASQMRFENARQSKTTSSEVFDSYTRQYAIGRKTWSDVLNALRESTQAQFALEDTQAQAAAAHLRLEAQCGDLVQPGSPSP